MTLIPLSSSSSSSSNKRRCDDALRRRNCQERNNTKPLRRAQDDEDTDFAVVSSKLNTMTLEERCQIEHEMHGIVFPNSNDEKGHEDDETEERIKMKLNDMNKALEELVALSRQTRRSNDETQDEDLQTLAYEIALERSPKYAEGLKLAFLRSEYYNSQAAARRMVYFFHRKRHLFGDVKLAQDILHSDLNWEDATALQNGLLQLLPHHDQAGRAVFLMDGRINGSISSTETVLRVMFYVEMGALRQATIETQKRGFVFVYYGFGQLKINEGRPKEFFKCWKSMPLRMVAVHICGEERMLNPAARQFYETAERSVVFRLRRHFGPHLEVLYRLMTFGIPIKESLFLRNDGTLDLSHHLDMMNNWIQREKQVIEQLPRVESMMMMSSPILLDSITSSNDQLTQGATSNNRKPSASTFTHGGVASDSASSSDDNDIEKEECVIPSSMDIVLGKGVRPSSSPGAMQLHEWLHLYKESYEAASKPKKTAISVEIFKKLQDSGIRFLKLTPNGYEICDDFVGREKISHGFRNLRIRDRLLSGATTRKKKSSSGGVTVESNNNTGASSKRRLES